MSVVKIEQVSDIKKCGQCYVDGTFNTSAPSCVDPISKLPLKKIRPPYYVTKSSEDPTALGTCYANNSDKDVSDRLKRVKREFNTVIGECTYAPIEEWKNNDLRRIHTYALSVGMLCVDAAASFAEEGFRVADTFSFAPERQVCVNPIGFDPDKLQLVQIEAASDPTKAAADAFQRSMSVFIKGITPLWMMCGAKGKASLDAFVTIVKNCVALPKAQILYHQTGFTTWALRDFKLKWEGKSGIWFTPMIDVEDMTEMKNSDSTKLNENNANYCAVVEKVVVGVVNIDAFEGPGGRRREKKTGFRVFSEALRDLCGETVQNFTVLGRNEMTPEFCENVVETITSETAGQGRDRRLPRLLDRGFRGWVLKYDVLKLERQIVLFPVARRRCAYWSMSEGPDEYVSKNEGAGRVLAQSFVRHFVRPLLKFDFSDDERNTSSLTRLSKILFSISFYEISNTWAWRKIFGAEALIHFDEYCDEREINSFISRMFKYELSVNSLLFDYILIFNSNVTSKVFRNEGYKIWATEKVRNTDLADGAMNNKIALSLLKRFWQKDAFQFWLKDAEFMNRLLAALVKDSDVEMVRMLIDPKLGDYRARPDYRESELLTHVAVRRSPEDLEMARTLIDPRLGDFRARPSDQRSRALLFAVRQDNVAMARTLLDPGLGDFRARPNDRESEVLITAVQKKNIEMVRVLLDSDLGSFRARPSDQESKALTEAARNDNVEMVRMLLDRNLGDFRARPGSRESQVLMMAVERNNIQMARILLDSSLGNLRARPRDQESRALMEAVKLGNVEMVNALLDDGLGDFRARPSDQESRALLMAVKLNSAEMVKILLDSRLGDYRARPSDQESQALGMAVSRKNAEITQMLLDPSLLGFRARPNDVLQVNDRENIAFVRNILRSFQTN